MKRGYILVVVIIIVMIISILFITQSNLTRDNTSTIVRQEQMAQAHFLSRSAIDLAYSALMSASTTPGYTLKIDLFKINTANVLNEVVNFPEGISNIRVFHDGNFIAIEAVSSITGTNVVSRVVLRINKDNYADYSWD